MPVPAPKAKANAIARITPGIGPNVYIKNPEMYQDETMVNIRGIKNLAAVVQLRFIYSPFRMYLVRRVYHDLCIPTSFSGLLPDSKIYILLSVPAISFPADGLKK